MRKTLSRLGLLVGTGALAVLGFTGTAAAAPPAPDSSTLAVASSDAKSTPAPTQTEAMTQAAFNGYCEYYELCMFRLTGFQGSGIDFPVNFGLDDATYRDNFFISSGTGNGEVVRNNAQSLYNADPYFFVYGCIEENFNGMCAYQPPLSGGDLFPDYFENLESHRYL